MLKPELFLENETDTILWDLEMQTDHIISAWIRDHVIINKNKNQPINGPNLLGGPWKEKQRNLKQRQVQRLEN